MLMIDDNMYRLAKMQESLLKVAKADRRYHLDNYIKNVTEIDKVAFDELVNIMKDANKYNQTLEIELSYLEKIKEAYNQLSELQMRFKAVCEQYGEKNLKLSDMSTLNIEYVENRINAINGYLVNVENIAKNKNRLEELNEELVDEEKKRDFLNKKIIIFEKKLKDDFIRTHIKQVVFGKLESFDIVTEYEKIGYDVRSLLEDTESLDNKFRDINVNLSEITEKYETARVCYNNLYNVDNKRIMDDIEREFYTIKYKYVMLKLLKLLAKEVDTYDLAKVKRNDFIELIKSRNECLNKLGIKNPLNILQFVDIDGQLEEINSLVENVQRIHNIRKEISELSIRTEEMINQNNDYLISLSDTRELIESKVSLNDIDITTFDDIVTEEVKEKEIPLSNQVVKVRNVSSDFRLSIARQKANGVIERVCNIDKKKIVNNTKEEYTPQLVIGPKEELKTVVIKEEVVEPIVEIPVLSIEISENISNDLVTEESKTEILEEKEVIFEDVQILEPVEVPVVLNTNIQEVTNEEIKVNEVNNNESIVENVVDTDIFETTTPFDQPVLFTDRTDNVTLMPESMNIISEPIMVQQPEPVSNEKEEVMFMPEIEEVPVSSEVVIQDNISSDDMMPDAFWVTESTSIKKDEEEKKIELSFDEQINALLAENNNESVIKRR